jgi:hypothetical protein
MNERYEQLLAQAHIEFAPDSKLVTKRFAELIVRECANVINSMDQSSQYFPHVATAIKEHFGVEE